MSKTFKATWLGDGDPSAQIIHEGGVRFIKGEPTDVPVDLKHNGIDWADNIRNSPAFAVEGEDLDVFESPDERKALTDALDAEGVKYPHKASNEKLRELLAK